MMKTLRKYQCINGLNTLSYLELQTVISPCDFFKLHLKTTSD